MSKLKKVLLMCTAYALVAALAIGGTIAYLQDEDSDVNVMTLGNVSIEQQEWQRADGVSHINAGAKEGDLVPFEQGQALYPAVPKNGAGSDYTAEQTNLFNWGVYSPGGNGLWNDNNLSNVMDKIVMVKNTGKSDAYYRTLIAFECPEGITIGEAGAGAEIMLNVNGNSRFTWETVDYITVSGTRYLVMVANYNEILTPGEVSRPSLLQVVMTHHATNEDMELLGDTYDILVFSQAVQAAGFDNAAVALDAAFGDITVANHPWVETIPVINESYFQNLKATEAYTVDGEGKTIVGVASNEEVFQWESNDSIPVMSAIFSSENGAKATVKDITFTGTMSSVMVGHHVNAIYRNFNTEFNNVNIVDAEVVSFTAGIAPALCVYGNLTMNDCIVEGTTLSPLDTTLWTAYDVAISNYSKLVLNDSIVGSLYMWNQAEVVVADGSEVDTIVIRGNMNTRKYGLKIEAGASVGAIDLTEVAKADRVNITIAQGATVGAFIDNGVEYATLDAWKAAQ